RGHGTVLSTVAKGTTAGSAGRLMVSRPAAEVQAASAGSVFPVPILGARPYLLIEGETQRMVAGGVLPRKGRISMSRPSLRPLGAAALSLAVAALGGFAALAQPTKDASKAKLAPPAGGGGPLGTWYMYANRCPLTVTIQDAGGGKYKGSLVDLDGVQE